ncbi:M20 family metallopeptidase [Hyphomonas sp.]|uniref:M20 metallopeptidase family protein n=1 Tax=Hyphomonas sp. TaxID=87 RepID=UPI0025BA398E|nr:amidohydrolase [Hyphomonas sp.]
MKNLLLAVSALALVTACGNETGAGPGGTGGTGEGSATAAAASIPGMPEGPLRVADENLVALYKQLHETPELSFKEAQTSALLANELKTLGFTVTEGVGDAWVKDKSMKDHGEVRAGVGGYGVVGVFENGPGPVILIRTDTDALPVPEQTGLPFASKVVSETWTGVESNVMHACAHDIHMTVWVGAARRLIAEKDKWKGTLVMIAQPAEEIGLGAQAMLAEGLYTKFPKPDYNIALHVSAGAPAGTIAYSSGFALANVDSVDIKVKGVGGHGAYPHTTVDPVLVASHIVVALQSLVSRNTNPLDSAVVTVGSIKAGAKHNIIPDEAELLITVRSYEDKTRQMLLDGIKRIAEGQAAAFGAPAPVITVESDFTPATYNDPDLTARAMAAISAELGAANVRAVPPVMGGEDFSQYARTDEKIPGVIFWLGAVSADKYAASQVDGMPLPSLHSPLFAPDYDPAIATGVDAMTAAVIDLFKD